MRFGQQEGADMLAAGKLRQMLAFLLLATRPQQCQAKAVVDMDNGRKTGVRRRELFDG